MALNAMIFQTLPAWIRRNPQHLSKLSKLEICVKQVGEEYMEILGSLLALHRLALLSRHPSGLIVIASGFRLLTSFWGSFKTGCEIVFQEGAMPKAEQVELRIDLWVANDEAAGILSIFLKMGAKDLPQSIN
jgi:hypothetical protein